MEDRPGQVEVERTTQVICIIERDGGEVMMAGLGRAMRSTLGTGKNFDTVDFEAATRGLGVKLHLAHHTNSHPSATSGRNTPHGLAVKQRIHKQIEDMFGRGKKVGDMRRTPLRYLDWVCWSFTPLLAAYNLVRLPVTSQVVV
jgi:hypothetical protein